MADEPQGRVNLNAKVAALVTNTQLAFNVGASAGVREGDVVHVIRDVQVDDPDSNEQLGTVRLIRLRLEVNHVQDALCVARVTDHVSSYDPFKPLTAVRALKRVAIGSESRSDDTVAYVDIGDPAVVKIRPAQDEGDGEDEEPPF